MKPGLLLALWRERWGKPSNSGQQVSYLDGRVVQWGTRLAFASLWSPAAVRIGTAALCVWVLGLLVLLRFSLHDQVIVSAVLACAALYLRRYAGMLITLAIAALSVVASLRYLAWRLSDTLPPEPGAHFYLGLALLFAELYLVLTWGVAAARKLWPLFHAPVALPANQDSWPTVDVFLMCQGRLQPEVHQALAVVSGWRWARGKRRIHLLDEAQRRDIRTLADPFGAVYHAPSEGRLTVPESVRQALAESHGDLVVVADCGFSDDSDFLLHACGWFAQDGALGMLTTPHHPLAPPPHAHSAALCKGQGGTSGSCALFRRAALHAGESEEPQLWAFDAELSGHLARNQYRTAYLAEQVDGVRARLDDPFSPALLRMKQKLRELDQALKAFLALARLVFLAAPLAYLFFGMEPIATEAGLLLAFAVPHLLHAYLLHARLEGDKRLSLWAEIRESLLACYLLVPTAFNLGRTWIAGLAYSARQAQPSAPARELLQAAMIVLCMAGLVAGLMRLPAEPETARQMSLLYLGWCLVNLLTLAGSLAVTREAAQVRSHAEQCAVIPAMIRLPYGRTISCTTANFPALDLELELPASVLVDAGGLVNASLFVGHRDYPFTMRVLEQRDRTLSVRVVDDEQTQYKAFAAGVLSRGKDWPMWLAGRDADRPVPAWIVKGLTSLAIGVLDFFTNIGHHARWLRPQNWAPNWKKRNE